MGYFILSPVLLADCKSEIGNCTAADCKSAETGIGTVGVPADLKSADKKRFDLFLCGFEIRRNKRGLQSSVGVPADLKSADKKGSTYFFADLKSTETSGEQAGIINPR
ncbi:hypothetical protein [Segatella copri]|uniref:hypothetical protein n=1 Tax=Segatella copri TaxID=165179 RepID=UPI003F8C68F2